MARGRLVFLLFLPFLLAGCYSDQKKQLQTCEATATRKGDGEPLRSIQSCMDKAGYNFVGYANTMAATVICDLPAVIQGRFTNSAALCFEPRGWLALKLYRWEVPERDVERPS